MMTRLLELYNITSKENNKLLLKKYKNKNNFILKLNTNYSTTLKNTLNNNINNLKIDSLINENQNRNYYSKLNSFGNNLYSPYDFFNKEALLIIEKFSLSNNNIDINNLINYIYKLNIKTSIKEISLYELTKKTLFISKNIFNTPIVTTEILLYTIFDILNFKKEKQFFYNLSKKIYQTENILKAFSNINNLYINYLVYKELSLLQWKEILKNEDFFTTFSMIPLFITTQIQYNTLNIEKLLFFNIIKKYI